MELGLGYLGIGIAFGLAVLGAGIGIGRLGGQVAEGISRQPGATKDISQVLYVGAGMIEGAALIAIILGFVTSLTLNGVLKDSVQAKATKAPVEQGQ